MHGALAVLLTRLRAGLVYSIAALGLSGFGCSCGLALLQMPSLKVVCSFQLAKPKASLGLEGSAFWKLPEAHQKSAE
jgi:hypothetical protein